MKTTQAQQAAKKQIKQKNLSKINGNVEQATEEQKTYSSILSSGRKFGLVVIATSLVAYLSGFLKAKVPMDVLPEYWNMTTANYLEATGLKGGWEWLNMYQYGDMLIFFGIAILGLVSVICYLSIMPSLIRKKDYAYFFIAIAEVLVLVLAASGLVNFGE